MAPFIPTCHQPKNLLPPSTTIKNLLAGRRSALYMDPRIAPRPNFPMIRRVGFLPPELPHSDPLEDPRSILQSPSMIVPHPLRDSDAASHSAGIPVPATAPMRISQGDGEDEGQLVVGSYDASQTVPGSSPTSSGIGLVDGEFSMDSANWILPEVSQKLLPALCNVGSEQATAADELAAPNRTSKRGGISDNDNGGQKAVEKPKQVQESSKQQKEKTTKAERRALQEAQRAAKAASRAVCNKPAAGGSPASVCEKSPKVLKQSSHKQDSNLMSTSSTMEKKRSNQTLVKDRKNDFPAPRMQFDDKSRVEKAKKRALLKQTESRNRVEMFLHLRQYEHGTQLHDLESKFFQLDSMHPAIYKVGVQHLAGDLSGSNARCVAMLQAIKEAINDYSLPPGKTFATSDIISKIKSYASFFDECRPLSISMGNAIQFLRGRIAKLPHTLSESEVKENLFSDIDGFINEKIVLADKVIIGHGVKKIKDGDVILTYSSSSVVEMIILHAHEIGKQFQVVIVDSRPMFEGQALLQRLLKKGINCAYTHISAVSYIMHEVTTVFLGAASILANGTVYSKVGSACVSMVAHAFRVPVLVCCEAYKFSKRVMLDSICCNELGNPNAVSLVPRGSGANYLKNWTDIENLQILNLVYDATPSDYISMIITDYGMVRALLLLSSSI
ncbi:unnamed protein product [Cuscuta epithymum]|uniref:Translation initiation factor eIF2B subunit delta n=1 Tax=Cuscuta epithymum TaxID=186058 RepID=A0AAV0GGX9_9ASTE|nr:unnamed protein product [Cuscuta epithymum]